MRYHVEFSSDARKPLKKMDTHISLMIVAWIRKHLEGCSNPYQHGKSLTANRSGQWRYRIGEYRLIAEILSDRVVILMLQTGLRMEQLSANESAMMSFQVGGPPNSAGLV